MKYSFTANEILIKNINIYCWKHQKEVYTDEDVVIIANRTMKEFFKMLNREQELKTECHNDVK